MRVCTRLRTAKRAKVPGNLPCNLHICYDILLIKLLVQVWLQANVAFRMVEMQLSRDYAKPNKFLNSGFGLL